MKKFGLLLIMLLAIMAMPFSVLAEGEENAENETETTDEVSEESKEVKIYFFRGEGCPHCAEAEEWFQSIEEEYGSKFEIVDYEVYNSQENSDLMDRVAEARDEEVTGVPYIIIGNQSWNGFSAELEDEILSQIESEYETEPSSRYDIMQLLPQLESESKEKSKSTDVVATIIIILVVGGVTFGIVKARKSTY